MNRKINDVAANHLCTSCGTCSGVCPSDALEMSETTFGQLIPNIDNDRCTDCGLCDKVCPQVNYSVPMKQYLKQPFLGPLDSAYLAASLSPSLAEQGQTGGLARSVLAYAIDSGFADAAVCVFDNPDIPLRPFAKLITSSKDAATVSRSKYCPVPVNSLIKKMLDFDGSIIFVGLPCHVQGLTLAMEKLPKLHERIVLKIGLFCDRILDYRAAEFICRCAGVKPSRLLQFDYRHNSWKGWPGHSRIVDRNNHIINISRNRRIDSRELFTPLHCRLCIDKLNALSDISLGDPYGLMKTRRVPTVVIVRNEKAKTVLLNAQKDKHISLEPADIQKVIRYQNISNHAQNYVYFARQARFLGLNLPWFLEDNPGIDLQGKRPLWVRFLLRLTLYSYTKKGDRKLRAIPSIMVTAWGFLRRTWNFGLKIIKKVRYRFRF